MELLSRAKMFGGWVEYYKHASRFCPNLAPHAHFICADCGEVYDIGLKNNAEMESVWALPEGARIDHLEVAMKGICAKCSGD